MAKKNLHSLTKEEPVADEQKAYQDEMVNGSDRYLLWWDVRGLIQR